MAKARLACAGAASKGAYWDRGGPANVEVGSWTDALVQAAGSMLAQAVTLPTSEYVATYLRTG